MSESRPLRYCIDSSSLIDLGRGYPSDIFVSLWDGLQKLVVNDRLFCSVEVLAEISRGDDSLSDWLKKEARGISRKLEADHLAIVRKILDKFPGWIDSDRESTDADPFIIALAVSKNYESDGSLFFGECVIVTEESVDPKKLRIPRIAGEFGVRSIKLHDMFRLEGWKF